MKSISLSIAALLFLAALMAPAEVTAEEFFGCSFISQVVNISVMQAFGIDGDPEVAGIVYFGYWRFNKRQNQWEGVATHQVFATKEWLPTLQAAFFDPRRPNMWISTEVEKLSDCSSFDRGVVSLITVNPNYKIQDMSGGGSGGGGGGLGKK